MIRWIPATMLAFSAVAGCGSDATVVKAEPCGVKSYPKAPAGASVVVHVAKGCPAAGADGSADHPYGTISDGLKAAPPGSSVVVAPGDYGESFGATQDVGVYGSDADVSDPTAAAVTVSAPAASPVTSKTGNVVFHGLKVSGALATGIWAVSGTLRVEACIVTGTKADASGMYGYGVLATGGTLVLDRSRVEQSFATGVVVGAANATITKTAITANGLGGIRLQGATGMNVMDGNTLDQNLQLGIGVFGAQAKLTGNTVSNTKPTGKLDPMTMIVDDIADGVIVASQSNTPTTMDSPVEMSGNTITGSDRMGVVFSAGAGGLVASNTVSGNGGGDHSLFGGGMWMQRGAGGDAGTMITGNTITGNHFVGIGLTSSARAQIMNNMAISDTISTMTFGLSSPGSDFVGDGLQILAGASANVVGNTIEKNGRFGVIADGVMAGTTSLQGNQIGENAAIGAVVQHAMGVDLTQNTYTANKMSDQKVLAPTDTAFFVRPDDQPVAGTNGTPL